MSSTHVSEPRWTKLHSLLVVTSVITGLASLISLVFWGYGIDKNTVHSSLASEISSKLATLNVKPRSIELTSETANRVRNAIKKDDYSTADRIAATVLASSRIENWRFHPFAEFIDGVADLNDPTFETHLNAWIALNGNDATPLLIRAK